MELIRFAILALFLVFLSVGCSRGSDTPHTAAEETPVNPNAPHGAERNLNFVTDCDKEEVQGYTIAWCHEYLAESDSKDVLYYFHGLDGSEKSWAVHPMRQALRGEYFKTVPHVITVSFGAKWFLTDVAGISRPARLPVFAQEVLPTILRKLNLQPSRQILMGESMGGFNIISLAHSMPQAFDRVVALCPAVMAYSPFWSAQEKDDYLAAHTHADGSILWKLAIYVMAVEFHLPSDWDRNNALVQAQAGAYALPPILMSANASDQLAFDDGVRKFAEVLKTQGQNPIVVEEPGMHCDHTPALYKEIADFTGL